MDLSRPLSVVTPTIDGDVLAVLARADKQFTPGDLQRMMGRYSLGGIRRALHRLAEQGIVTEQQTSASVLYGLNRLHLAAAPIRALADLRATFISRTSSLLESWDTPPEFAALFGSAARGDMRVDSDIDLFVVRSGDADGEDEVWQRQLGELAEQVTAWTGNDARVLEYAIDRVERSREPLLAAIAEDGVPLYGSLAWFESARGAGRRR